MIFEISDIFNRFKYLILNLFLKCKIQAKSKYKKHNREDFLLAKDLPLKMSPHNKKPNLSKSTRNLINNKNSQAKNLYPKKN
jgi:hypothetical protein